jgi:hypothetical protein
VERKSSRTSAFVADYFTLTNAAKVKYLGADGPRLGVFVVDAGGEPRAMVGPVAKGYEAETAIEHRLDDEGGGYANGGALPHDGTFEVTDLLCVEDELARAALCVSKCARREERRDVHLAEPRLAALDGGVRPR